MDKIYDLQDSYGFFEAVGEPSILCDRSYGRRRIRQVIEGVEENEVNDNVVERDRFHLRGINDMNIFGTNIYIAVSKIS